MDEEWTQEEIDMCQVNDYMIVNYIHKITRKWEEIQGHKIEKWEDLSADAKKEIEDWYAAHPRDLESIRKIIAKQKNNQIPSKGKE